MQSPPRHLFVLLPYVVSVVAIILLANTGFGILSAERSYMGAERLWAQQQKVAVGSLYRFAQSGDRVHYTEFVQALAIPEAHLRARIELNKPIPDIGRIREDLVASGNDARDIDGMITLFQRFSNFDFMDRVAAVWLEMASPIGELRQLGEAMHGQLALESPPHAGLQWSIGRIQVLEGELARLENAFASALDNRFRTSQRWLSVGFVLVAGLLAFFAMGLSRLLWRRMTAGAETFHANQERLNLVINGSNDGAWDWDLVKNEIYYSPRFKQMLSISDDQPGYDRQTFFANLHPDDRPAVRAAFRHHVRRDAPYDVDFRLRTRTGDFGWFHARGKVVKDCRGKPVRMAGSVTEISERKRLESELAFLAAHDPLTGVLNRRKFKEILVHALQVRGSDEEKPTLLYLDLDQFKVVNDTCGHAAGDQLLRDVTDLLGRNLGERDVVARLGGDEFAILLNGRSIESSWSFAEALRQAIHDFQFVHQDRAFSLSVSIGVVVLEPGLDTIDAVLTHADRACYLAKEEGRNRICLYAQSDRDIVLRREEMDWVSRLRKAISEDRLQLYAQPIVAVHGARGQPTHVELLLRLIDEEGNVVPPMAFIPAAERYGLMPDIDRWVIEAAFSLFAVHAANTPGAENETWAINLSGMTLGDDEFPSFLQRQFMAHGVPFNVICFEVTETAVVSDLRRAGKFMRVMKSLGCRFALDDFGAGASSFSYLKRLPVDYLKIDASLVRDLLSDPIDDVMVEAINRIGHVMKIATIAEGVESEALLSRLGEIGIDYAQGYCLGMPERFCPDNAAADHDCEGARGEHSLAQSRTRIEAAH